MWAALKKMEMSLGDRNVKGTEEDENEVVTFLEMERGKNEREEQVPQVETYEESERLEEERKMFEEEMCDKYVTEEEDRWLLRSVEAVEDEIDERKFIAYTMNNLSLGESVFSAEVESDDEIDEIQALEMERETYEEERCVQYVIDEDDRLLGNVAFDVESMFAATSHETKPTTSTPKKRGRRGATHYMPRKRKAESYYASPELVAFLLSFRQKHFNLTVILLTTNLYLCVFLFRAVEERDQIEEERCRLEAIQRGELEGKDVGFQQDCKQCNVAKEWGHEACFYHNPRFRFQ